MGRKIKFGFWIIIVSFISILVSLVGSLIVIASLAPTLLGHALLTLLLMYGIAFTLFFLSMRSRFEKPVRLAGFLALLPVVLVATYCITLNAVALRQQPVPVDDDLIAALESHTIPLSSVDNSDLDALRSFLEGRQVVALGEATHGTSEFFRMKHSVIAYLVTDLGFRNYGMEILPEDGVFLNRYIHGENVDPKMVLYWPWATEEVMNMLDWMRAYNAKAETENQLTLYGIDPRAGDRDRLMAENVVEIVKGHGPIVIWAHNAHISANEGAIGDHLKRVYDEDAYLIGFEFSQGEFTSRTNKIHTFSVDAAPPTYYAYALAMLNTPVLFLDMATMQQEPKLEKWFNTPQRTHHIAELYHFARFLPGARTLYQPLPDSYDGLIFVEESSPATVLPSAE